MLLRIALFALMAVGLLGFGAVAWVSTHPAAPPAAPPPPAAAPEPSPPPPPPPPAKVTVTVAAHSLRAGSFIRPDDLRAAEMEADDVPAGAMPDSPAVRGQLNGAMLRRGVGEGEALTAADVFKPGDHGFLASVLAPGMRAVMVGLNGVEAGAGFVWPGDRVDLILTEQLTDADIKARRRYAGETVLENARVVAVDQVLVPGGAADDGKSGDSGNGAGHRIAVEVPPEAAERLAVASLLGHLTVSLRPAFEGSGPTHMVSAAFGMGQDVACDSPRSRAGLQWASQTCLEPFHPDGRQGGPTPGLPNPGLPTPGTSNPGTSNPGTSNSGTTTQGSNLGSRRVTWSGDVSRALDLPVRQVPPPPLQLFRGSTTVGDRN